MFARRFFFFLVLPFVLYYIPALLLKRRLVREGFKSRLVRRLVLAIVLLLTVVYVGSGIRFWFPYVGAILANPGVPLRKIRIMSPHLVFATYVNFHSAICGMLYLGLLLRIVFGSIKNFFRSCLNWIRQVTGL
jgi:hypothetical protein